MYTIGKCNPIHSFVLLSRISVYNTYICIYLYLFSILLFVVRLFTISHFYKQVATNNHVHINWFNITECFKCIRQWIKFSNYRVNLSCNLLSMSKLFYKIVTQIYFLDEMYTFLMLCILWQNLAPLHFY